MKDGGERDWVWSGVDKGVERNWVLSGVDKVVDGR